MSRERHSRLRLAVMGCLCLQLVFSGLSLAGLATKAEAAPILSQTDATLANQSKSLAGPHTVVSTCNDAGLAAAIATGGTITFNCPSPYTINLTSQKSINNIVSIDGTNGGHQITIDGGNTYRVFYINGAAGNLTLNNIKIAHGNATSAPVNPGYGGGIDNEGGTASLTYVFFDTNKASSGGGFYNAFGATATLNQVYFDFNYASYGGGGLFNDGILSDVNSGHYANNTTDNYGAGIFFNGGKTTFSYVSFDGNISGAYGGAIYTNNGALTTTNTTSFTNNQARSQGGAIYNGLGSPNVLRIDNATFTGNKVTGYNSTAGADSSGGAIYTYRTGAVNISNSTFTSNSAKGGDGSGNYGGTAYGGAIAADHTTTSGPLTITNSIFNMNKALGGDGSGNYGGDAYGGAISAGYGPKTIISTTFSSNTAQGGKGYGNGSGRAYGGAFSDETNVVYRIRSSTFYGNIAQGGDSYGHGAGSAFGGAIDNDNNALPFLTNSTIFGNQALGGVGGASNYGGDAYGGGVYNYAGGASLTIINATLSQNTARGGTSGLVASISKGSGLYSETGSGITISNTINSGNALANNCDGQINDGGYNLEYGSATCGLSSIKNDQSGDPKLGLPTNNGGPTQTQALQTGSAAIDNGNDATCASSNIGNIDQRGFARPFGTHCDIGAYEFIYPTITTSFTPPAINPGGTSVLSFVINNSSGVNVSSGSFTATLASQITLNGLPTGCGATVNINGNVISVSGIGLATGTSCTITANVTANTLGTFFNNTSPLTSTQFGTVGVGTTTTFTVTNATLPSPYNYNLPLLANNANTAVGQTTTFITFQNLSTSAAANVTIQYYGIGDGSNGPTETPFTIPPKGQKAILPAIPTGSSFGGIVGSSQPLNLVVSEALNGGGSAYNVAASTAATLYSPIALNGQYGFTTSIIVFNASNSGNATGQIQFFDDTGAAVPGATQTLNIPAHASQSFNQAAAASGLNGNHAYWAKIVGAAGSQLTAQVIEFGPSNFVATFNAIGPSQVQPKLYAPATFNGQFNFVTGMALANPNAATANLSIKYYNAAGIQRLATTKTIPANGVIGVFQPAEVGLPTDVTSAVISSDQPLISTINEKGPGTISGTYVGLASGSTNVALPVMAKGFVSFVTGATVLNTGSSAATLTFTYYDQSGTQVGSPQTPPALAPNASFLVYQGDAAQGLPANFFGTAIITSNQPLLVTTNALQTGTGLFYTYTEPSS